MCQASLPRLLLIANLLERHRSGGLCGTLVVSEDADEELW
jgi:hypothetical protein